MLFLPVSDKTATCDSVIHLTLDFRTDWYCWCGLQLLKEHRKSLRFVAVVVFLVETQLKHGRLLSSEGLKKKAYSECDDSHLWPKLCFAEENRL